MCRLKLDRITFNSINEQMAEWLERFSRRMRLERQIIQWLEKSPRNKKVHNGSLPKLLVIYETQEPANNEGSLKQLLHKLEVREHTLKTYSKM